MVLKQKKQLYRWREEDLERLRNFRLLDDDFMTKCFEGDPRYIEFVLRIILDMENLQVIEVHTQAFVDNLTNRSVKLDVLARTISGCTINVEIQRADKGAGFVRARYHHSQIDSNLLPKGEKVEDLPVTYVIFITEHDVIGRGLPIYHFEKRIVETGQIIDDGQHTIYVNGAYRDESPIGKLMHDFSCTKADDMHYSLLAERVRFFKESKEGVDIMCKSMEDLRDKSWKEGQEEEKEQTVLRMLESGKYSLEDAAFASGLSIEEVEKIQTQNDSANKYA